MKKKIIIGTCNDCLFSIFDDANLMERWGKLWCLKLNG
jgi:hypothetical protein